MGPPKPLARRFSNICRPTDPSRSHAPITTMARGANRRSRLWGPITLRVRDDFAAAIPDDDRAGRIVCAPRLVNRAGRTRAVMQRFCDTCRTYAVVRRVCSWLLPAFEYPRLQRGCCLGLCVVFALVFVVVFALLLCLLFL